MAAASRAEFPKVATEQMAESAKFCSFGLEEEAEDDS